MSKELPIHITAFVEFLKTERELLKSQNIDLQKLQDDIPRNSLDEIVAFIDDWFEEQGFFHIFTDICEGLQPTRLLDDQSTAEQVSLAVGLITNGIAETKIYIDNSPNPDQPESNQNEPESNQSKES